MPSTPLRRNREYVALWLGQAVSNLGISISSFAYPLVVLEATGSAAKAGLVGSVLAGTAFLLRLPAGVLVDRWNRKAIMVACEAGRALNAAGFAAALASGSFYLPHVLFVAFVEAALGVLFGPAETAAVRRVVGPEQVRDAVARNESRAAVPSVVGPPLGGTLLAAGRVLGATAFVLGPAINTVAFATIADEAPAAMQGRATSAGIQVARLAAPVGPVVAGALLATLGATTTVVVYGCLMLLLAVVASVDPRLDP